MGHGPNETVKVHVVQKIISVILESSYNTDVSSRVICSGKFGFN